MNLSRSGIFLKLNYFYSLVLVVIGVKGKMFSFLKLSGRDAELFCEGKEAEADLSDEEKKEYLPSLEEKWSELTEEEEWSELTEEEKRLYSILPIIIYDQEAELVIERLEYLRKVRKEKDTHS